MAITVSSLAAQVGVSADTVRYYERVGLLAAAPRTSAGYRLFTDEAADRLRFIKGAQSLGLRLADIRDLLEIRDRGTCPCGHTEKLLRQRVAEIDGELPRLQALRKELVVLLDEHPETSCPDPDGKWWCEVEFAERR